MIFRQSPKPPNMYKLCQSRSFNMLQRAYAPQFCLTMLMLCLKDGEGRGRSLLPFTVSLRVINFKRLARKSPIAAYKG